MRDTVNFSHKYWKLSYPRFPTIRGKSWEKQIGRLNMLQRITVKYEFFCHAELIYKKVLPINHIPSKFLQWDVLPKRVKSYWEFLSILNKFRRFNKLVNPDALVCVLIFDKIEV